MSRGGDVHICRSKVAVGAHFDAGKLVERPDEHTTPTAA